MSSKSNGANVGAVRKNGSLMPSLVIFQKPPKKSPYGSSNNNSNDSPNAKQRTG